MMPAYFASNPDLYLASGLEGLHGNLADIVSTPLTPAVGYPLGRVSALEQGMGEGLLLTFSGQASGE